MLLSDDPTNSSSPMNTALLITVLVLTMALGAFPIVGTAVVANALAEDLTMSLTLFGAGVAVNTAFGAVFAPVSGRLSDRHGGKWSCVLVLLSSGVGLLILACAPSASILIFGLFVSSYGQGACNPATNKLVAERAAPGHRGKLTGIKQSGVQLGILLGGFTLPALSIWLNWRVAIGLYAMAAILVAALAVVALPDSRDRTQPSFPSNEKSPTLELPRSVSLIALYALCMGCVVGGVGRYTVLFAENALQMSNVAAGLVAGLPGGIAIGTRIIWAHLAEHRIRPPVALAIQSSLTALVMAMLCIAAPVGSWIMWPVAVVSALGLNAWNAVAMLYVIIGVPQQASGRASGRVVMGFMTGLTVGGFLTGLVADVTGSYETAWASLLLLSLIATFLAWQSEKARFSQPAS